MKFKLKTEPWEHQLKALEFLSRLDAGALYTDMGTGKTKVIIDLINNKPEVKTILIVCPNKIVEDNLWQNEFIKHSFDQAILIPELRNLSTSERFRVIKESQAEVKLSNQKLVIVINYESVWREPLKKYLLSKKGNIDMVVCDESHRIKSPSSKCSGFLTTLGRRVKYRYLVTGTPMANSPLDIYAQYRFLDPTIFGTRLNEFKDQYSNYIKRDGYCVPDKKTPYKNLEELHDKMFSVAFLQKSKVKLPKTRTEVVNFTLSERGEDYYRTIRKDSCILLKEGYVEATNILALMTRLQQICSGYIKLTEESKEQKEVQVDKNRMKACYKILKQIPKDEPVVIFAKYRKDLKNLTTICARAERSVAEVSGRLNELAEWKLGHKNVLIAQIQSGAEGLDLTRACYCIYYSLHHSLTLYRQSRKRVHRPGQTRRVRYYLLCAQIAPKKGKHLSSIDEQIIEALKNKQNVIQNIMSTHEI